MLTGWAWRKEVSLEQEKKGTTFGYVIHFHIPIPPTWLSNINYMRNSEPRTEIQNVTLFIKRWHFIVKG